MARDAKGRFIRTTPDYKAMYEDVCKNRHYWRDLSKQRGEKLVFLYRIAPFWVKWKFNRKFREQ